MQVTIFRITQQRTLEPIPLEGFSSTWPKDDTHRWIDIEAQSTEEIEDLLSPFGMTREIVERCVEPGRGVYVAPHDEALYLEIPTLADWHAASPIYLSIVCMRTTLITIHREAIPSVASLGVALTGKKRLSTVSTSALLHDLLEDIVDQCYKMLIEVRERFDALTAAFIENPHSIETGNLIELRQPITNLRTTLEDYLHCNNLLLNVKSEIFDTQGLRDQLTNLGRNAERLLNTVSRYQDQGRNLYQFLLAASQEKTNNRLRVLTIISAVFLPLSVLSGIFGMNFVDMPGTDSHWGFLVAIGVMVAFGVAALSFFYRRGWFD